MVGICAQLPIRCGLATASARTLPSSCSGLAVQENQQAPAPPPVRPGAAAGPEPRYGSSTMVVLASALSCDTEIAGEVAGPEVPKLILVGFALASATRSATER